MSAGVTTFLTLGAIFVLAAATRAVLKWRDIEVPPITERFWRGLVGILGVALLITGGVLAFRTSDQSSKPVASPALPSGQSLTRTATASTADSSSSRSTQPQLNAGGGCWDHSSYPTWNQIVVLSAFGNINVDSGGRVSAAANESTKQCGGTLSFDPSTVPGQVNFSRSVITASRPGTIAECLAAGGGSAYDDYQITGADNGQYLCGPDNRDGEYLVVLIVDASHVNDGLSSAKVSLAPVSFIH